MIDAVVFDLDGVLLDSEARWDRVRREVVAEHGGRWRDGATAAMQGMSAPEWSAYLRRELGVELGAPAIVERVVDRLRQSYRRDLPLMDGAREAVARLAARWPLALASSSNRVVFEDVLAEAALSDRFVVTISSEEVARGKPAPDVYFEAARRLDVPPPRCAAIEDSANGIRAAVAAGMATVAIPHAQYPPPADVLASSAAVCDSLFDVTVELVSQLGGGTTDGAGPVARGRRTGSTS